MNLLDRKTRRGYFGNYVVEHESAGPLCVRMYHHNVIRPPYVRAYTVRVVVIGVPDLHPLAPTNAVDSHATLLSVSGSKFNFFVNMSRRKFMPVKS